MIYPVKYQNTSEDIPKPYNYDIIFNAVYGPVPSRRLGFSLGIDLVPYKICSFNCIYCQLGKTTNKTIERKEYLPAHEILRQIKKNLKKGEHIDYLTFSGSGEPTLNSKIGYLINKIKKITKIPVAVLTSGSLLFMPDVQDDLLNADVVLPTLCAATPETFEKVNRPHPAINIDKIIKGMIDFRKKYKGKIWLEVMLIKGFNDSPKEIKKLKTIIAKIKPDKIQLNTVVRPPSEKFASPLSIEELQKIKSIFGKNCEIIAEFKEKDKKLSISDKEEAILNLIKRRPVTLDDITSVLSLNRNEATKYLNNLQKNKKIKLVVHAEKKYYEQFS